MDFNNMDECEKNFMDINESIMDFVQPKRTLLVGPWEHSEDLKLIYKWIYSADTNEKTKQLALSEMKVWHLRRVDLCPATVLATMELLQLDLLDEKNINATQLQSIYANGLTRFYNFISSILQTHNMRTMYDIANELSIHSFVVDLRHLCSHGQVLPPLNILKNTVKYCFAWIRDFYWSKQIASVSNVEASEMRHYAHSEFEQIVRDLFSNYDVALKCYCRGATTIENAIEFLNSNEYDELSEYCADDKLDTPKRAMNSVVKDFETLIKESATRLWDTSEIFIDAFLKTKFILTLNSTNINSEKSLMIAVRGLFNLLGKYGFMENFFYALLNITETTIGNVQLVVGASFWAIQMIKFYMRYRKKNTNKLMVGELWTWSVTREFMQEHTYFANKYSAQILLKLIPLIDQKLNEREELAYRNLFKIMFFEKDEKITAIENNTNKNDDNSDDDDDTYYTAEDLLKSVDESEALLNGIGIAISNNKVFGVWKMFQDNETYNWKECPLGKVCFGT